MGRVIVAEDEHAIRLLVAYILEQQGYPFTMVENGQQALDAVRREDCILLLADVKMPVLNGLELVQVAREEYPELPIVIMTAHTADAIEAMRRGADSYVIKPFTRDMLLDQLRRHVGSPSSASPSLDSRPGWARI